MKGILQVLFGYYFLFRLIDFKRKYLPNERQKEIKRNEDAEIMKRKKFYSSFVKPNDLCFDVGANVGNRVGPLLEIGANVVAIEPQESCYKYLQYKFGKRIEIITKGLGEGETVKDFHLSRYTAISSFSDEWINSVKEGRFKGNTWSKIVKIEMTTLNKLIEKFGVPAFIKIDVEGYELEVLKGLSKAVNMISFEYTVPEQTHKTIDCINQLQKINSNIECNYSIGESMTFKLKDWISATEMKEHIISDEFVKTGFGDVYVRNISRNLINF